MQKSQYRQGDVLLERINALPDDAVPVKGPIILAEGEATGHAHRVRSRGAKLFERAGERFLRVTSAVRVEHEEDGAIDLEPGTYRVKRQREYSPEAIRNVAD